MVGLVLGSRAFVSFGISSDYTDFIEYVEYSDLDTETQDELVTRLEALRDRARDGDRVGFFEWLGYDQSIRSFISDGTITDADLEAFERELDRLERQR